MSKKYTKIDINVGLPSFLPKEIAWVGSSLDDIKKMPLAVRKEIGFALYQAQIGELHIHAKPFKGLGSGVYEIVTDFNKNTYRALYFVKLRGKLYVLHAFQKKSKTGIKTPKEDLEIIANRLKRVKNKSY